MKRHLAALFAVLTMFCLGTGVGTASATDNATYYIGTTWNVWTHEWPGSYYPPQTYVGVGRFDHGGSFQVFQSGATQYSRLLGGAGSGGNSSKMVWYPCDGVSFISPCNSGGGSVQLKQVVLQDRYGVVATAVPSAGHDMPHINANYAYGDTIGIDNSLRPHVTVTGNVDYVALGNGYSPVPFTTSWVSGTGGFTTAIPLTWTPQLCWNFQSSDFYGDGTVYHFWVCAPLVPHNV